VIASGQVRQHNYGAASPYLDLTLPCGSSICVSLNLAPPRELVTKLCEQLDARNEARLTLKITSGQWLKYHEGHVDQASYFVCRYQVPKRLVVIGKGAILEHVIQIGAASGLEVLCYSPDYIASTANRIALASAQHFNPEDLDSATAVLLLFHDHDWETPILKKVLEYPVCYIGALGSFNSHQQRISELRSSGYTEADWNKITSPAGLIKGTRHPQHIALSMVAEAMEKLCNR
jgi:xanthine dehydrogenase accessory factor